MQYSIFLAAALFGVKALSHSVPVYSSFWIGQISGEQECGVGGGGGASSACNEGGTWASSDLSNFCDHVGVGSVFPAAKGPKTNWCNVTDHFPNVQSGHDVVLSNVGPVATDKMCGQNGGFTGDYNGIYALLFDHTTDPGYTSQIGTCYFDTDAVKKTNCANVAGSMLYNSNIRCDVQGKWTESGKKEKKWIA